MTVLLKSTLSDEQPSQWTVLQRLQSVGAITRMSGRASEEVVHLTRDLSKLGSLASSATPLWRMPTKWDSSAPAPTRALNLCIFLRDDRFIGGGLSTGVRICCRGHNGIFESGDAGQHRVVWRQRRRGGAFSPDLGHYFIGSRINVPKFCLFTELKALSRGGDFFGSEPKTRNVAFHRVDVLGRSSKGAEHADDRLSPCPIDSPIRPSL